MVWSTEEASGWWDTLQPLECATMEWVGFDGAPDLLGTFLCVPMVGEASRRGFPEPVFAFPILALASARSQALGEPQTRGSLPGSREVAHPNRQDK